MSQQELEELLGKLHRDPHLELQVKGALLRALEPFGFKPQEREVLVSAGLGRLEAVSGFTAATSGQGAPLAPAVRKSPKAPSKMPAKPKKPNK